ncbi:MAG: SDR family NAD(P)-dependent oxidoreductase [Solirubrobacteraceae bacterium]
MSDRAAIVTGASRGIGFAIAELLATEGYQLTLTARRSATLLQAADTLASRGHDVQQFPADLADEDGIRAVVAAHRRRYGRLDVLVNSGGVIAGAGAHEHPTQSIDMQLDVNLRAIMLFYRESLELLRAAGAEHGNALVVNLASLAGKIPQPWVSVYSATKAAVIAYSAAMNRELGRYGVKSVALCPGFVDTDFNNGLPGGPVRERMIRPQDVAASVRFLLVLSPAAVVPEIIFQGPSGVA